MKFTGMLKLEKFAYNAFALAEKLKRSSSQFFVLINIMSILKKV